MLSVFRYNLITYITKIKITWLINFVSENCNIYKSNKFSAIQNGSPIELGLDYLESGKSEFA